MQQLINRLGQQGLLDADAQEQARALVADGQPVESAVLAVDGVAEEAMLRSLAEMLHVDYVDLEHNLPPKELVARFPVRLLVKHNLLPVAEADGVATIATSKPSDLSGLDRLRLATGLDCVPALARGEEIDRAIKKILGVGADTIQSLDDAGGGIQVLDEEDNDLDSEDAAHDATIIRFVNQILIEAIEQRATDVHIEPYEDQLRLRYRIDGVLQEENVPPTLRRFHPAIVSRLKILSHLDIAEKRVPQDGRIKLKLAGKEVDVRVSIIPMIHGEAVVMRMLARSSAMVGLDTLGMGDRDGRVFNEVLDMPHGIVLVTGPTGSGKTTTLYAGLNVINDAERKIITIEDPVEYQLKGVNQIQVNKKTGLTFAAGLRAILRHDPDVVLVGEIRDKETAEIAVQASLTGHLVFSTLHTNDAPGAATRLIDMGVEPYLVASSLEVVLAQRLVRLICKECKRKMPADEHRRAVDNFGDKVPEVLYHGKGCRTCGGTGYRGRQGVFELMQISDEVRSMILQRTPSHTLRKVAAAEGMSSLRDDGWRIVGQGRTTIDEVMRNTKEEGAVHTGNHGESEQTSDAVEAASEAVTA